MVAPACSWPGLAWGASTSVSPEVVTGIRVPLDVAEGDPAVLASEYCPLDRDEARWVHRAERLSDGDDSGLDRPVGPGAAHRD